MGEAFQVISRLLPNQWEEVRGITLLERKAWRKWGEEREEFLLNDSGLPWSRSHHSGREESRKT